MWITLNLQWERINRINDITTVHYTLGMIDVLYLYFIRICA